MIFYFSMQCHDTDKLLFHTFFYWSVAGQARLIESRYFIIKQKTSTSAGQIPAAQSFFLWVKRVFCVGLVPAPVQAGLSIISTSRGKYLFRSALQRPGVPLRPHVHRLRLGNHLRGWRPRQDPPEGGENIFKQQEEYLRTSKNISG